MLGKLGKTPDLPNGRTELLESLFDELRESFAELNIHAEKVLAGRRFIFNRYGRVLYPYFSWETDASKINVGLILARDARTVASVDSTCVLLGEAQEGSLYAARAGVGISFDGSLRKFIRLGPVLVYLSKDGFCGLRAKFSSPEIGALLSDHGIAERVIRNILERKVVDSLLASEECLIVMADGSLKHPMGSFAGRLPASRNVESCLVGFSKSSSLLFSEAALESVSSSRGAAYHTVEEGPISTVLAKFSPDGIVFRLDLAECYQPIEITLGRILANDSFSAGYPESLKIAHHLSIFTRAEGAALRACVTKRFRLHELPTFDLRRVALGTLGGS